MVTEKDRVTDELQKYIKKAQWDKAIQSLDRLAALEPDNTVHRLRAGDYYLKLGATQRAVTAYDQAADLFTKGGFVVKALAAYKMILRLDPQNKTAHAKMQGLHGPACELAAFSQYVITADTPLSGKAASTASPSIGEEETAVASPGAPPNEVEPREPESGSLDRGRFDVLTSDAGGGAAETPSMEDAAVGNAAGSLEIERTSYADSGGAPSKPAAAPIEPAPQESPPARRSTDVIPLFSSLTPEEFSEVVERMAHFQYPPGYRIVKEGDRGDSVYLISQGAVQVMTKVGSREILLAELKDSDFFGEVGFLTGRPRTASVITRTETEILELSGENLKTIVRKFPRVREVMEAFYKTRVKDTLSKIKRPEPWP